MYVPSAPFAFNGGRLAWSAAFTVSSSMPASSAARAPAYRPHTERTVRTSSGVAGSFVLSGTRNSWGPPIPSCMVNSIESVVDSRGFKVV